MLKPQNQWGQTRSKSMGSDSIDLPKSKSKSRKSIESDPIDSSVWQQEYSGRAALAKADQTRQIIVTQANAELESARAMADAIGIMGEAAHKYPEYRQQEFIGAFAEALKEGKINQIIYVPTEANIPILEAGKR
ncbi:MAG: hypothetical protein Q8L93_11245 [Rhodocyclaceae bacterium]|nr:hypothetical protein [Rhodocyclaceae bacterium]